MRLREVQLFCLCCGAGFQSLRESSRGRFLSRRESPQRLKPVEVVRVMYELKLVPFITAAYCPDHLMSLRLTSSRVEGAHVFPRSRLTQCNAVLLFNSAAAYMI
jgi:hypothetical protein